MSENTTIVIVVCAFVVTSIIGLTVSSFAPDATAARIAACMQQPNMEYRQNGSCVRVDVEH
jgi:hypothetical protein